MSVRPFLSTNFLCGSWMFEPSSALGAAARDRHTNDRMNERYWRMILKCFRHGDRVETIIERQGQVHCGREAPAFGIPAVPVTWAARYDVKEHKILFFLGPNSTKQHQTRPNNTKSGNQGERFSGQCFLSGFCLVVVACGTFRFFVRL